MGRRVAPTMLGVAVVVAAASAGASSADPFYELGVGIADATGPITDVCSVPHHQASSSFDKKVSVSIDHSVELLKHCCCCSHRMREWTDGGRRDSCPTVLFR